MQDSSIPEAFEWILENEVEKSVRTAHLYDEAEALDTIPGKLTEPFLRVLQSHDVRCEKWSARKAHSSIVRLQRAKHSRQKWYDHLTSHFGRAAYLWITLCINLQSQRLRIWDAVSRVSVSGNKQNVCLQEWEDYSLVPTSDFDKEDITVRSPRNIVNVSIKNNINRINTSQTFYFIFETTIGPHKG